jgi:hypothetical protein
VKKCAGYDNSSLHDKILVVLRQVGSVYHNTKVLCSGRCRPDFGRKEGRATRYHPAIQPHHDTMTTTGQDSMSQLTPWVTLEPPMAGFMPSSLITCGKNASPLDGLLVRRMTTFLEFEAQAVGKLQVILDLSELLVLHNGPWIVIV